MRFLQILYESSAHDDVFNYLKRRFGTCVSSVKVTPVIPDELVRIEWEGLEDPAVIAADMTEKLPSIIIETPTTTGIDVSSRFFNKNQLW